MGARDEKSSQGERERENEGKERIERWNQAG